MSCSNHDGWGRGVVPKEICLPAHVLGDRWPAGEDENTVLTVGPVTFNGAAGLNALSRFVMSFVNGENRFVIDTEAGADHQASITDAAAWVVEVPVTQSFLSVAGVWRWDAAFYDAVNASPITLFCGDLRVKEQV